MVSKRLASGLTTVELHHLDQACAPIRRAFRAMPYLVGSAGVGSDGTYRDVDVRLMLADGEFEAVCPTIERWGFLCLAISVYLSQRTGLPVDFQIQRTDLANEKFSGSRNPLSGARDFAGGGDATPDWSATP